MQQQQSQFACDLSSSFEALLSQREAILHLRNEAQRFETRPKIAWNFATSSSYVLKLVWPAGKSWNSVENAKWPPRKSRVCVLCSLRGVLANLPAVLSCGRGVISDYSCLSALPDLDVYGKFLWFFSLGRSLWNSCCCWTKWALISSSWRKMLQVREMGAKYLNGFSSAILATLEVTLG